MLKLSLAQCLKATTNQTFDTKDLDLLDPMSPEDVIFLAEYLRVTPLTSINLSMDIDKANSFALMELARTIAKNPNLTKLHFEVTDVLFEYYLPPVPGFKILGSIDRHRLNNINNRVIDAVAEMVGNKPKLTNLTINLNEVSTPASNSQTKKIAQNLRIAPLKMTEVNIRIEPGAQAPIPKKGALNTQLNMLVVHHCSYADALFQNLNNTTSLKTLALESVTFTEMEFQSLKKVLDTNKNLTYLGLSKTNIGQMDNNFLFDWLKTNSKIAILDLSECNLNRANIDALCSYLASGSCSLTELDLTHNSYMGDDMVKLAQALTNAKHLESLILNDNFIETEGIEAILKLLRQNRNITSVALSKYSRYPASDSVIDELAAFLRSPKCQLKELIFDQKISAEQLTVLTAAIEKNERLTSVTLNYDGIENVHAKICDLQIKLRLLGKDKTINLADDPDNFLDAITDRIEKPESSVNDLSSTFFSVYRADIPTCTVSSGSTMEISAGLYRA